MGALLWAHVVLQLLLFGAAMLLVWFEWKERV
jgi:hypothetical protein